MREIKYHAYLDSEERTILLHLIKEGQEVKAGTPLIRFNRQKIKEAGYSDVTVCVITDGADEKTVHFHTGIYAQENETVIIEIE